MNAHLAPLLVLAAALASPVVAQERQADQADHRLGQHPAVIIKKLSATQGYDYVAKFYPHPAWLYLLPEAPGSTIEPSADVAARQTERGATEPNVLVPLARARD